MMPDHTLRQALEAQLASLPVMTHANGYPVQALPKPDLLALLKMYPASVGAITTETEQALAQAMWQALRILGFDLDGDPTPAAMVAGSGVDGFIRHFLDDVDQARRDHDAAIDEVSLSPARSGGV